uniref:palmitoyl-protein hydrolase n=1 Tax=Anopheles christyi TaxID=43041 RepID=A0A182JS86_9DIPT
MGLLRRNSLNIGKWFPAGKQETPTAAPPAPGTNGPSRASFGSSVAIQKLRESKWFDAGEERIFCAVIENGFIVEVRRQTDPTDSWFGVVSIELKKSELKPTADHVKIYSVRMKENEKKPMKVYCVTLCNLWQQGHQLRINNVADRTKKAHPEKDILAQISDCAKWGGLNMGATLIFMEMQKKQNFGELCCLFCCPPLPGRIAAKLAFLPPEPTYNLTPIDESKAKYLLSFNERAEWPYSEREKENVEGFFTRTSRGNKLSCIYVKCTPTAKYTLLFSHGNAVDLGQMSSFYLGLGLRINCNIFSYDYSGYGMSGGKPSEKNLYADIEAAWHSLRTRFGVSPENIILYGQSIGTVPTVDLAARYEVGAVILHSPLMSGMRVAFPNTKRTWFFDVFPSIDKVSKITSPVLVIHGTEDEVIDFSHGLSIYEKCPKAVEPLWVEGAGHNDVELYNQYLDRLKKFIAHSTISSSIRKELASYENPYQTQALGGGVRKKPTKRNASTESLDLFDKCPPEECSCGLYSPSSINGGKGCRKCSSACDSTGTSKSVPSTIQQKKHNSSKFKDASTSPKSSSPLKAIVPPECRSPKLEASTDTKFDFSFSPKTESHYRRLSSLSINSSGGKHAASASPMKHATGANATLAASSASVSPKLSPQKLTPIRTSDQRTLEKSNSLGESKPPRLLRNTRSLSPRPPVRHQHSIMVSDENDIISVKLSPNEEYCDEENAKRRDTTKKQEAKVEPQGVTEARSDSSTLKSSAAGANGGEKVKKMSDGLKSANNNRSTSCLVYVPSDPWTRMSASNSPLPSSKQQKSKTLDNSAKAYGKPCLDYMKNTDPWVWRSNVNLPERVTKGGGKKRNAALSHQTKSLTSTVSRDDSDVSKHQPKLCQQQSLGRFEKTLTIPGVDGSFDARKKITRPKLQRSKSPSFYEDFFQQPSTGGTDSNKSPQTGSLSLAKNKSVSSLKIEKNASNSNLNGHGSSGAGGSGVISNSNTNNSSSNNTSNSGSFSSYNGNNNGSPTGWRQPSPKLSIPPATQHLPSPAKHGPVAPSSSTNHQQDTTKASLNLLNPNMLQPRHSFSTPSQRDDELQLNIRRLSEQINKYSHSSAFPSPPAFLNDTILQQHVATSRKVGGSGSSLTVVPSTDSIGGLNESSQRKTASHSKINEPILETRC